MVTITNIGSKIKVFRKQQNLSAAAFAEKHGLSVYNLYKWETGTRPGVEDYKKLEKILENIEEKTPIDNPIGVSLEAAIRAESKLDVTLSYVAEIFAHLKGQPATKVLQDMVEQVNQRSAKTFDELQRNS